MKELYLCCYSRVKIGTYFSEAIAVLKGCSFSQTLYEYTWSGDLYNDEESEANLYILHFSDDPGTYSDQIFFHVVTNTMG